EPDLLAGVLPEQDAITCFDVERNPLRAVLGPAAAGRHHRALLRLFLRTVGDDDSPAPLFAFVEAVNDDPVVERSNIHLFAPNCSVAERPLLFASRAFSCDARVSQ